MLSIFSLTFWGCGDDEVCSTPSTHDTDSNGQGTTSDAFYLYNDFTSEMGSHQYRTNTSTSQITFVGVATHNGESDQWICTCSKYDIDNNHTGNWVKLTSDKLRLVLKSNSGGGDAVFIPEPGKFFTPQWSGQTCQPDRQPGVFSGRWYNPSLSHLMIVGGGGNDIIFANGNANKLLFVAGGSGNDYVSASGRQASGGGLSYVFGGTGNDILIAGPNSEVDLFGGDGQDRLVNNGGSCVALYCGSNSDLSSSTTPPSEIIACESSLLATPYAYEICTGSLCSYIDAVGQGIR